MTRVGIATIQPRTGPLWTAFEQRLKELGYAEGENLAVEFIDLNGTVEKELRRHESGNGPLADLLFTLANIRSRK
jgi:hypothetical protein